MTDEQRDELNRLRMKDAQPDMVTVPKELLRKILNAAKANSDGFAEIAVEAAPMPLVNRFSAFLDVAGDWPD